MIQRPVLVILSLAGVFFATPKLAHAAGEPSGQFVARPLHKPIVILAGKMQNDWSNIEDSLNLMKFEIIKNPVVGQPINLSNQQSAIIMQFEPNCTDEFRAQTIGGVAGSLLLQYGVAVRIFWVEPANASPWNPLNRTTGLNSKNPGSFHDLQQGAQPAWHSPLPTTTLANGISVQTIRLTSSYPSSASAYPAGEEVRLAILKEYSSAWEEGLTFTVLSFPVKLGFIPSSADVIFDARDLRDPFFVPALKEPDGRIPAVQNYIAADPLTQLYWSAYIQQTLPIFMYRLYETTLLNGKEKHDITIAFGCSGGHHRSVFSTERLGDWLRKTKKRNVTVRHLGLELAGTSTAPQGATPARELLRIPNNFPLNLEAPSPVQQPQVSIPMIGKSQISGQPYGLVGSRSFFNQVIAPTGFVPSGPVIPQ